MRNSGWYIPFWRKPKRTQGDIAPGEKPDKERRRKPRPRSEEDLERVREEWVLRYTRKVHAFAVLGLSVGTPQDEITLRYKELVAAVVPAPNAAQRLHVLHEAYETLHHPE